MSTFMWDDNDRVPDVTAADFRTSHAARYDAVGPFFRRLATPVS